MTSQLGSTPADGEVVAAARVLLQRMGVDPADLMAPPQQRRPVPTFADYIPTVEAAVSAGTARTYRSYWNRIAAKWGSRTLLEPTPSEIAQFREEIKASAVVRRTPSISWRSTPHPSGRPGAQRRSIRPDRGGHDLSCPSRVAGLVPVGGESGGAAGARGLRVVLDGRGRLAYRVAADGWVACCRGRPGLPAARAVMPW